MNTTTRIAPTAEPRTRLRQAPGRAGLGEPDSRRGRPATGRTGPANGPSRNGTGRTSPLEAPATLRTVRSLDRGVTATAPRPGGSARTGQAATRTAPARPFAPPVPPRVVRDAGRAGRAKSSPAGIALPRMPFVLLVLGLLGGGLVCLLVVNTTLGATSFQLSQLQHLNAKLSLQQQTLEAKLQNEQAPGEIAQRAYQLGMRAETNATILDLRSGRTYRLHDQGSALIAAGTTPQATRAPADTHSGAKKGAAKKGAAKKGAARHGVPKKRAGRHRKPATKTGSGA
jgi:hypothetical protein